MTKIITKDNDVYQVRESFAEVGLQMDNDSSILTVTVQRSGGVPTIFPKVTVARVEDR